MANLIIKPTSGGSLILQDEGGTAANTIDASGNTQLAGTLGVTGASTMTGNVTMSGTGNNLGTVTAGSIAGGTITNATTFPTGHVIKVTNEEFRPAHTLTSGTTTVATTSITPDAKTNKLFIECLSTFQLYGNGANANPSFDIEIYHNGTLIDNIHDVHNNNVGSTSAHNFVQPLSRDLLDVDHASASGARNIEIKAKWARGRFYTDTNWYGHRITIWEIA